MKLSVLANRINSIDIGNILWTVVAETRPYIIELVRDQIEHGKTSEDYLNLYKTERYARIKASMGSKAPYGISDLKFTGKFLSKLYARMNKGSFTVRSRDEKNARFLRMYGPELYVLDDEHLELYVKYITPLIQNRVKNGLLQ